MIEIFRDIQNYERYQVSNLGKVRNKKTGRILKPFFNRYVRVTLFKNKKKVNFSVHRLIMEAFVPNPDNLPQVNHKDENKHNNFVWVNPDGTVDLEKSNLEWCTAKYNINYSTRTKKRKGHIAANRKRVKCIETGTIYPSILAAENEMGKKQNSISKVCRKLLKTAYGYTWEYVQ